MRWIRVLWESRSHAVLGTIFGTTYMTYCGRTFRMEASTEGKEDGPKCAGCQTRVRCPYPIPEVLTQNLDATAKGGV